MPEKKVCENVRRATSESDLKLTGDKIKLETRPSGKDSRASSKCSMLSMGPSRPVSALPLLSLYDKDDYDTGLKTKRPLSAPFHVNNQLKSFNSDSIGDGDDSSSLRSIEGNKTALSFNLKLSRYKRTPNKDVRKSLSYVFDRKQLSSL